MVIARPQIDFASIGAVVGFSQKWPIFDSHRLLKGEWRYDHETNLCFSHYRAHYRLYVVWVQ